MSFQLRNYFPIMVDDSCTGNEKITQENGLMWTNLGSNYSQVGPPTIPKTAVAGQVAGPPLHGRWAQFLTKSSRPVNLTTKSWPQQWSTTASARINQYEYQPSSINYHQPKYSILRHWCWLIVACHSTVTTVTILNRHCTSAIKITIALKLTVLNHPKPKSCDNDQWSFHYLDDSTKHTKQSRAVCDSQLLVMVSANHHQASLSTID